MGRVPDKRSAVQNVVLPKLLLGVGVMWCQ